LHLAETLRIHAQTFGSDAHLLNSEPQPLNSRAHLLSTDAQPLKSEPQSLNSHVYLSRIGV